VTRLASRPVEPGWVSSPPVLRVMGILNVTPDSFSDGGRYLDVDEAVARGERMISEGADVLDIGGESTRPRAEPVSEEEEMARVIPVIAGLRARTEVPLSIDTRKSAVARAAVAAGATLWNDVTGLTGDPDSTATAASLGCEVVLMHMQGEPRTMQVSPCYHDVVAEVASWLAGRAEQAMAAGVPPERIWLDPGIGFGKTVAHNLRLLACLDHIVALGFPVLLGASRKGFIRTLDRSAVNPEDRLGGSLAVALAAAAAGCAMVRVHDVAQTVQALRLARAIELARSAHG